ncbi:MAG: hypothetical protein IJU70_10480 [Lentisphaeria bacterium]|nr:hypothetical protein [Lentisphaeria bacterium]
MDSVFEIKVKKLAEADPRYAADAYRFVTEAVTFSVNRLEAHRHVTARELMEGIRDYAAREYGALAREVLTSWGLETASDVGEIVYKLIGVELLSASPGDKRSDFDIDFPPAPSIGEETIPASLPIALPKID